MEFKTNIMMNNDIKLSQILGEAVSNHIMG